jgi:DNA-binding response OmpR family regulator
MEILVVDPKGAIGGVTAPVFEAKGWTNSIVKDRVEVVASTLRSVPDVILIHGDGAAGDAAHLCQRLKANPLTAGIPLVLVEDGAPPTWMLMSMPADAVAQAPWEPPELVHHIEVLSPSLDGTGLLDDLTNFPRRRSVITELERRMVVREVFAAGLLMLREADAYRQDYGRTGLDQFVVLISILLRRNATGGTPLSIGYLDEGTFLILGSPNTVHRVVAQTIREFEALVPAFYEMDALFGTEEQEAGPKTWIGVHGSVSIVEPGRYDNVLQVGFVLAETIASGNDTLRDVTAREAPVRAESFAAD